MEITEVRIKLNNRSTDRLKAYCTITFDDVFVVRDVKIVDGTHGLFVAMPSRKLSVPCPKCRHSSPLRSRFCNGCGARLSVRELPVDPDGRARLHRDIAHPITPSFREHLQTRVIEAYEAETELARDPGYAPPPLDADDETFTTRPHREASEYDTLIADLRGNGGASVGESAKAAADTAERSSMSERSAEGAGERRGRRRRRTRRPERDPSHEGRSQPPSCEDAPSAATTASEPAAAAVGSAEVNDGKRSCEPEADSSPIHIGDDDPVIKPERTPPEEAADHVELQKAAGAPQSSDDSSEDSAAFGAGIL
jgi:stage V sporulation protein G